MRAARLAPTISRRLLTPAPAASWDPARKSKASIDAPTIGVTVHLPEDAVLEARAEVGATLLDALEASDLSDVWEGGACGGACSCSTCRVIVEVMPAQLGERADDEEDMLDSAVAAAQRQAGDGADVDAIAEEYLRERSRLACQLVMRKEDNGLAVRLPNDVTNMLEVPLWLRGSR